MECGHHAPPYLGEATTPLRTQKTAKKTVPQGDVTNCSTAFVTVPSRHFLSLSHWKSTRLGLPATAHLNRHSPPPPPPPLILIFICFLLFHPTLVLENMRFARAFGVFPQSEFGLTPYLMLFTFSPYLASRKHTLQKGILGICDTEVGLTWAVSTKVTHGAHPLCVELAFCGPVFGLFLL